MLPVETPFKTYTGLDGKPLDGGFIYFGQPNQNPITAPVTVYWDAAGTQPAFQPLRTVNGYIVNKAGAPANVFFDGSYSELVQDSKGRQVFYSKTSDSFSIATVVSNFITKLASAVGAALIGYSNGGTQITVEEGLDLAYYGVADVRNPRFAGGADATGDTFSTDAFKAAFAASPFVQVPAGTYKLDDTISATPTGAFRLVGAGMGLTFIQMWVDKDMFSVTNTAGSTQFSFEDMTLQPRVNMVAGAAINVRNDTALPSLRVSNLFIGQSSTYEWKYGIKAQNCTEAHFYRVVMYGLGTANFIPYEISATAATTVSKWFGCSVYNARYAWHFVNNISPGIEGAQWYGCDAAGVAYGVLFENPYGPGYFPPQITWVGGHINASVRNFDLSIVTQINIRGALLYNSGIGPFISLTTCSNYSITGNQFVSNAGSAHGITIATTADPIDGGLIADNVFNVAGDCISIDASRIINNLRIANNQRISGGKTVSVTAGTLSSSVVLVGNTLDADDLYESLAAPVGGILSMAGARSDFLLVSSGGTPVTVTQLTGVPAGASVTLKSDDTNLTLAHDGINPDGFLLKGALNFTFSSGSLITLRKANGGYLTEISRSV